MDKSVYIILVAVLIVMSVGDIIFGARMIKSPEQKKIGKIMLVCGISMLLCGAVLLFAISSAL